MMALLADCACGNHCYCVNYWAMIMGGLLIAGFFFILGGMSALRAQS